MTHLFEMYLCVLFMHTLILIYPYVVKVRTYQHFEKLNKSLGMTKIIEIAWGRLDTEVVPRSCDYPVKWPNEQL